MAQSVEHPTSAQVTISRSVDSSPTSGSGLTARSLEPASDSASPSLSLLLPRSCSVSLYLSRINVKNFFLNHDDVIRYRGTRQSVCPKGAVATMNC